MGHTAQTHRATTPHRPAMTSLGSYADTEWDITTGVGFTALAVAAGRAIETHRSDRLISDPHAARFVDAARASVPFPTGASTDTVTGTDADDDETGQLRELWESLSTYIGVRTRYFDHDLRTACHETGIRQVVLLAAGLDSRAIRLEWPDGTRVFEIDHPNVLTFKDHVLAEHHAPGRAPCARHPVGVDLRDDWPTTLRQAGFDPALPTAWLAEGLLFYLPDDAKHLLCQRVHDLSAPGSRWAVESMTDPAAEMAAMRDHAMLQWMTDRYGVDPTGIWPPEQQWEPQSWLIRQGWTVTATSAHTVAARYQRRLVGSAIMAEHRHPSVLFSAVREGPVAAP